MFNFHKSKNAKTKTLIIAEIGINHNGDIDKAKLLIEKANDCGASAVKLQTYITEKRASKDSPIYEVLKKCELSFDQQNNLFKFGQDLGIEIFSTPFDEESVQFLGQTDCKFIKIASFDVTNFKLVRSISSLNKQIIMSTGMTNENELKQSLSIFDKETVEHKLALLHCISSYPAPENMANLASIKALRSFFNGPVGYSDHTIGWSVPVFSIFAGATIIEKHFTLDCEEEGPDHKLSADPIMLKKIIENVQKAEEILGEEKVCISNAESDFLQYKRKSI